MSLEASRQKDPGYFVEWIQARMGWAGLLVAGCQLRWVLALELGLCVWVVSLAVLRRDGYPPRPVSERFLDGARGYAQRCVTIVPLRQDSSQRDNNTSRAWRVHRK